MKLIKHTNKHFPECVPYPVETNGFAIVRIYTHQGMCGTSSEPLKEAVTTMGAKINFSGYGKQCEADQLTFIGTSMPWVVCPVCGGSSTAECERCYGEGMVPAPDAPAWMQRVIREHARYQKALMEIVDYGHPQTMEFSNAFHREIKKIAWEALRKNSYPSLPSPKGEGKIE